MKTTILLFCLIGVSQCALSQDELVEKLSKLEPVLKDVEMMNKVFACLMDEQPCGEMQYIKDGIPQLIENKCETCSKENKVRFNNLIQGLQEGYPEQYKAIILKFGKNL